MNTRDHIVGRALVACAVLTAFACSSSAPSPQLVDARRAYQNAQDSPAARYTPEDLLAARQALDRAERAHHEDPGSTREAHLAYIAARRAQIAIVNGATAQAEQIEAQAEAHYRERLEQQAAERARPPETPAAKSLPADPKREAVDPLEPELAPEPTAPPRQHAPEQHRPALD